VGSSRPRTPYGRLAEALVNRVNGGFEPALALGRRGDAGEQIQLGGVAGQLPDGYADQADRFEFAGPFIEQRSGREPEPLGCVGRLAQRRAAGDGLEIAEADFHRDGPRPQAVMTQSCRYLLGLFEHYAANLIGVGDIDAERLFLADALGFAIGCDGAVVDAECQAPEVIALVGADAAVEYIFVELAQVCERFDTKAVQLRRGLGADAPDLVDWQRRKDRLEVFARDDGETVGLVHVAGELGEELVRCHADRRGQASFCSDARSKRARDGDGVAEEGLARGDVEERLVDAQWFNERRERFEDREHVAGYDAVAVEVDGDDNRVRTVALGDGHRLGGVATEGAGFVRGRGDDAAWTVVTDQHGFAAERGLGKHLDGREERIHVDVQDRAVYCSAARRHGTQV
jgi:hypothetical protein